MLLPVYRKTNDMNTNRILSLDIFRGLTIFTMVFVNDVAGVRGLPYWMGHAPANGDYMTFVDVVFPAFLFIVGMSIPFAIRNRLKKGQGALEIWKHMLIRTFGLIVLGVFMVNAEEMNRAANPIPASWWNVLLYISAILIWNQYPKAEDWKRYLYGGLQILGVVTLIVLSQLYVKGEEGNLGGMTTSWWGILGLIGWAYFLSVVVYWFFREQLSAMIGILGLYILITVGLMNENLVLPDFLSWLKGWKGHFSHATLTLSGIVLSMLFLEHTPTNNASSRIRWMLTIGLAFLIGGYFLRPLYGIGKIGATPTWALYSAAICCFIYPLVYWLADVKGISRWANFLEPAGFNPLLTYILPFIFYAVAGFSYLPAAFNEGILGVLRSILFSLFILGVAALLTRRRVRLQF